MAPNTGYTRIKRGTRSVRTLPADFHLRAPANRYDNRSTAAPNHLPSLSRCPPILKPSVAFTPSPPSAPPPCLLPRPWAQGLPRQALLQACRDGQQRQALGGSGKGGKTCRAGGVVSGEAFGCVGAAFVNARSSKAKQELLEDSSHSLPVGLLWQFEARAVSRTRSCPTPFWFAVYIRTFRLLQTQQVAF